MIYLAADHRGYQLKEKIKKWLAEFGHKYEDCGNEVYDPEDDYTDFATKVAKEIRNSKFEIRNFGILVCGTGIGMDMVANKFAHTRCGLGFFVEQVKRGREEDNINCLALPADFITDEEAKEMIRVFLETKFLGKEKYQRRLEKMAKIAKTPEV